MNASELPHAVAAGMSAARALGLDATDAVVLASSNRIAVRLLPCDVLARVAPLTHEAAAFEVEVALRLAQTDAPVAELDPRVEPRVHVQDGFAVTLWTYYEPLDSRISPREYAHALERLHSGMRQIDLASPHFTDRIREAERLVGDPDLTPHLAAPDRELLSDTLARLKRMLVNSGAAEQLLHGEPHHGNLLNTRNGLLFIDLETCCRGPIEFDLAHCVPPDLARTGDTLLDDGRPGAVWEHYPGADPALVHACTVLMLAMVAAWRADKRDQFPNGREAGRQYIAAVRQALHRYGLEN